VKPRIAAGAGMLVSFGRGDNFVCAKIESAKSKIIPQKRKGAKKEAKKEAKKTNKFFTGIRRIPLARDLTQV
jgi:hypothetical protein